MKPSKTEIKAFLGELQEVFKPVEKVVQERDKALRDAEQLEKTIAQLGEPAYDDAPGIQKQETASKQLAMCRKKIEDLERQFDRLRDDGHQVLGQGGQIVGLLLGEIYNRRIETITGSLLPFCSTQNQAKELAKSTPAALSAQQHIQNFRSIQNCGTGAESVTAFRRLELVLTEALKDSPDLMSYIPFHSAKA